MDSIEADLLFGDTVLVNHPQDTLEVAAGYKLKQYFFLDLHS